MAQPPHKRAKRPDSNQMWEENDRRAPARDREEPRDRREDRDRDRNRRYRSRSPRESRDARGRGTRGERGGKEEKDSRVRDRGRDRREDRTRKGSERDNAPGRGEYLSAEERHRELVIRSRSNDQQDDVRQSREKVDDKRAGSGRGRGEYTSSSRGGNKILPYRLGFNSQEDNAREKPQRSRSRSPIRDFKDDETNDPTRTKTLKAEEEFTKARTVTPPVSFNLGSGHAVGQDHDRMDIDGEAVKKGSKSKKPVAEEEEEDDDIVIEDSGLADMQAMMGFGGFGTTQQKKIPGNNAYAVRKEKKTEYRQYMNRVGGFNRPLSPPREH